jgi:hypothetical protein
VTAGAKVNAQLSPEDLIHMVDVSIASKYAADLTQFTWVMEDDMRSDDSSGSSFGLPMGFRPDGCEFGFIFAPMG